MGRLIKGPWAFGATDDQDLMSPSDDLEYVASDVNALGVLKAARELNLDIPNDLAVVGFDDIDIADYIGLTTVKQPLEGSGREAALLINKLIKDPTSTKPVRIYLPLELIVRTSS